MKKADFKDRLKVAMDMRGRRAVDLVELTGIPKVTMSYYLNGKTEPKADRIYLLAKELDVDEVWLMGYDVPMMENLPPQWNELPKEEQMRRANAAKRLNEAITLRNMKPIDLANTTGISKASISGYMLGKYEPKPARLRTMAKVLNVSEAWLMGYEGALMDRMDQEDKPQPHKRPAFKDRLVVALEKTGKHQADLCKHLCIPSSAMSYYVSGRSVPSPDRVQEIAKHLGVSEGWLMGYNCPMKDENDDELSEIISILSQDRKLLKTTRRIASLSAEQQCAIADLIKSMCPEEEKRSESE